jgi:site-specific recombinase XerD
MKRKTFKILFFLKKSKLLKNGEAPICMRITVDGKMCDVQIKRSTPVEQWNQAKECAKGKGRAIEELNRYLESIRIKLYQIYRELEENGKAITVDKIKNIYLGNDESRKTILQLFSEHNAQCRQLIGRDFAPITVQRYETTARYLKEFMLSKYHISDIALTEITPVFVHDFEVFLKVEKQCAQNAAITRLKNLKKMIRIALENDWIKKSPFIGLKFKSEETHPEFLTLEEIQTIASKNIGIERLAQIRDVFIFCCYTGLAFCDVQQLSEEHLVKGQNGEMWIRKARQKTKNMCNIPLLPIPVEMIEKYRNHPDCIKSGKLFPVPSNQKMNAYLKEIADICGINKNLTTHCARHSFATSIGLANGVSMENVAKMLGHSDISITKHYARVLDASVLRDMANVEKALTLKKQAV